MPSLGNLALILPKLNALIDRSMYCQILKMDLQWPFGQVGQ